MDERAFEAMAGATLERLAQLLEDQLADDADVELRGGILTVELEAGGQFVVNRHAPTREILLSSPVSGASHFARRGEAWTSTRGSERLEDVLAADLEHAVGRRPELG